MMRNARSVPQLWRTVTFLLCLLCVITMLIPGSHIYYSDAGKHIGSYIWNHAMPHSLFGFLAALLAMISSLWGMKERKSVVQPMLVCGIPAASFSWIVASFGIERIAKEPLILLNILPFILSVASILTAVIAWFVGRKEA